MIEQKINILSEEVISQADAICFTANGIIRSDGKLVMGAGVAKAFANRFPTLPKQAGDRVKAKGNHTHCFEYISRDKSKPITSGWGDSVEEFDKDLVSLYIVSFPTKNHWRNPSGLGLIEQSARELMELVTEKDWKKVYLPFPGVGLGKLSKDVVRDMIGDILDDRVIICSL